MSVFIIAEVGQAHDGSLGILHSYIDAAVKVGVNAVKFQTHIAHAESSQFEPFRVKFSYEDKTRFDYWKRVSFDKKQWIEIKLHCEDVGLEFMSSPFSVAAVDLLDSIGMEKFKIGSGEVTNHLLLDAVCATGKEIILSSGMSSYEELDAATSRIKALGNKLTVLQCTTKYPTSTKDVGLNQLNILASRYDVPVGLSDHSGTIFPSIAAVAIGATVIEAHIVFNNQMFGPDSSSSLELDQFGYMVEGIRDVSSMLENPVEKGVDGFGGLKDIFEKSLAVNKDMKKGELVQVSDLEAKKPKGMGVLASQYQSVIGKRLTRDLSSWDFLNGEDVC